MSDQKFIGNERESEIEITNRIISLQKIPSISNVISTLQSQSSQSTTFSSSDRRPNSDDDLLVNPPFPPNIDPKVLANGLFNRQKKSKKMLNEFFIYRGEFVRELKRLNLRPKQTRVSSLASTSWHRQPPSVKDEYRRLARETEQLFMAEKQREANVSPRTESNESSPKDSTSTSASSTPDPDNYQLPSQISPLEQQQMSGLQTNHIFAQTFDNYCGRNTYHIHPNLIWPYLRSTPDAPYILNCYQNAEAVVPSQSVQETDFFMNDLS